jgi:hypothetical protein
VSIKPFGAWYPRIPYEYPERCVERSDYPTWTISKLVYNHSSAGRQRLKFEVVNVMNGAKLECDVPLNETRTRGEMHASRWRNCSDVAGNGETSATQVLFDNDYGVLGIKQTWRCHDNVPANDERCVPPPSQITYDQEETNM